MCASSTFSLHLHSSCFLLFIFLHKGKNEEEQNQHMKTKTWETEKRGRRKERTRRRRAGGTEEGEAISENKGAFKSKGWKLVGLLFLKNDPCVVLLLRARYILFYLPEDTQRGALAQRKSATVSFKLHTLLFLMWFLTAARYLLCKRLFWSDLVFL